MKKLFILLLIAATFSVAGYSQTYHYDVNGDGVVTAADVTALYDYMLGNVPSHEYVDLGLPSGTLWATMNIGASNPEEYGDYFAWGETVIKDVYNWSTYKWCMGDWNKLTKYCLNSSWGIVDFKTELEPEDDAATVNWGPEWQTPSHEQIEELKNNCTSKWTTSINGVNGQLFTSKINGATLFFPAAGYRHNEGLYHTGSIGEYWSRTVYDNSSSSAWDLWFRSSQSLATSNMNRDIGHSVRAVRVSQK